MTAPDDDAEPSRRSLNGWGPYVAGGMVLLTLWVVVFTRAANHGRATVGAMEYQTGRLLFAFIPAVLLAVALFSASTFAAAWLRRWELRNGGDGKQMDRESSLFFPLYVLVAGVLLLSMLGRGVVFDMERGRSSLASISRELRRIFIGTETPVPDGGAIDPWAGKAVRRLPRL